MSTIPQPTADKIAEAHELLNQVWVLLNAADNRLPGSLTQALRWDLLSARVTVCEVQRALRALDTPVAAAGAA